MDEGKKKIRLARHFGVFKKPLPHSHRLANLTIAQGNNTKMLPSPSGSAAGQAAIPTEQISHDLSHANAAMAEFGISSPQLFQFSSVLRNARLFFTPALFDLKRHRTLSEGSRLGKKAKIPGLTGSGRHDALSPFNHLGEAGAWPQGGYPAPQRAHSRSKNR